MNTERVPQTDSIEELARFWDTHDLTEFEGELEEVPGPVFERETVVNLRLPSSEAEAVRRMAESKGVGFTDLISQWIRERIQTP
jgi:predicted DNA binding CopG/RHH family protein